MNKSFRSFAVFEIQTWPTPLAEQMSPRSAGLLKRRPGTGLTTGQLCSTHGNLPFQCHPFSFLGLERVLKLIQ